MKITVEVTRKPNGLLEARVVQEGKRGRDLLSKRCLSGVAAAQIEAQRLLAGYEVEFIGEAIDGANRKATDQRVSTPRDRYGWRSL